MSHIDPGLDVPTQEAAKDVEQQSRKEGNFSERNEREYLDPSRWWFASTACPLIAGTFGPMANAFSICALVEKWRIFIPIGSDEAHGQKIEDPKWLVTMNSISLLFALTANLALLLNMARRLSFKIAQPITIIGWYLASILLIVLVAVASTDVFRIPPRQQHALSQAYYYGIIAAALYFIVSTLMVINVHGALRGHYPQEFRLTSSQRTLMLQTIGFMIYLLLGALVFSKVEGWHFLDGVFWANFTLLTVGVGGEYVPKTHVGRSLLFPFAIGGIVMLGLVIGSIRSLVLERGKEKMTARFTETQRENVIASIKNNERTVRLGIFEGIGFSQKAETEPERQEQEFIIMREVQASAERRRRYTALAISSIAAGLLWLVGAVVFMRSEEPQSWTYFISLYFAYTSLLTIGYGDFTLSSNSGKSFFVFWSLLAVPTLTILISNMGDTVIKSFTKITLRLGSLTVLPERLETSSMTKDASKPKIEVKKTGVTRMFTSGEWKEFKSSGTSTGFNGNQSKDLADEDNRQSKEGGDDISTLPGTHEFHRLLSMVKEVKGLVKDMDSSPSRQYTYKEWKYYLRLLRDNESDPGNRHVHRRSRHTQSQQLLSPGSERDDSEDDHESWSWLGVQSPLIDNRSETRWLLDKLTETLELEIRSMRPTTKSHLSPAIQK